ncbi:hypothetical protein GBA52_003734 [Prunus armeniaca]|nr:hypothetical protein GBA52_003734 [Prunus armeniaca]
MAVVGLRLLAIAMVVFAGCAVTCWIGYGWAQAEVGYDNEETEVPETQIEEDNNPTPNENDSNPTVTENNNTEVTSSTQATVNKRKGRSPA